MLQVTKMSFLLIIGHIKTVFCMAVPLLTGGGGVLQRECVQTNASHISQQCPVRLGRKCLDTALALAVFLNE